MEAVGGREAAVLVVGAGMAGISAALWARRVGLPLRWIEAAPTLGGQLARIHGPIPDYAGLTAPNGRLFLARLEDQLSDAGLSPELGVSLSVVDAARAEVTLSSGERLAPGALVLATGAGPRRLEVPGEERLRGAGVSDSATRDRESLRGRITAVVGGGDAALENALILAECCPRVWLIHRGGAFRGRPAFQAAVAAHPGIEVRLGTRIAAILGDASVGALALEGPAGPERLPVEAVVVKVGVAPRLGPFAGLLDVDPAGYVRVDATQRTSLPWVWAAGDVCNPLASSLAAAGGHAATAIKAIEQAWAAQGDR